MEEFMFEAMKTDDNQSTVTVSGIGTIFFQPDMVRMTIGFSHTAQTTKEAKEEVAKTIRQMLDILKEEGVEEKNIKTVSIYYEEATEHTDRGRIHLGQRAQQSIMVEINDIEKNPNRFPVLLDRLAAFDGVRIWNSKFDIKNKTELYKQSREFAYQDALDKASQYAHLSGRKIVKVLSIRENEYSVQSAALLSNDEYESFSVPRGEQKVASTIMVTFLLE
jgi:uncharacterized protein YggE